MRTGRAVDRNGFHDARDLGGSPNRDGGRTVVDLRNDGEVGDAAPVPPGTARLHVPLDGVEDTELWRSLREQRLDGTPLYHTSFLRRRPDRVAAVLTALARTAPGGVVFHCNAGRDRTGLVTLLLLALAGVEPDAVAEDHAQSVEPLRALCALVGRPDAQPGIERVLADRATTAAAAVLATLEELDVAAYLRDAGMGDEEPDTLRARLVG